MRILVKSGGGVGADLARDEYAAVPFTLNPNSFDPEPNRLYRNVPSPRFAQENAFYQSLVTPTRELEYRDKTRHLRLGEISIDRVGWGTVLADLDLDGRVATLEEVRAGRIEVPYRTNGENTSGHAAAGGEAPGG